MDILIRCLQPPRIPHPRSKIEIPAITEPHQGASYNPPVHSHQDLLRVAHEAAERKEKDVEKFAGVKEAMEAARRNAEETPEGVARGMTLDEPIPDDEDAVDGSELVQEPVKLPARKTKQQRRKSAVQRAEVCLFTNSHTQITRPYLAFMIETRTG